MRQVVLFLLPVILLIGQGCTSAGDTTTDPRRAALNMIRAMEDNDREAIAHYLDFQSLMQPGETDYALQMDSIRVFTDLEAMLDDLTEGGLTHQRWMAMQRIVGDATQMGDTAHVEVSFISKETNKQFLTKWGLRKMNERWKIFSFHAQ